MKKSTKLTVFMVLLVIGFVIVANIPFFVEVTQSLSIALPFFGAFFLSALILVIDWSYRQKGIEETVDRTRKTIIRELRRNHCLAEKPFQNLISTNGWDLFVRVASHFESEEVDRLLDCYTAMDFYNHEVVFGQSMLDEKKEKKHNRVLRTIKDTLSALGSSTPSGEECKEITKHYSG